MRGPIDPMSGGPRARGTATGGRRAAGTGRFRRPALLGFASLTALVLLVAPLDGQQSGEGEGQAEEDTVSAPDTASARNPEAGEAASGEREVGEAAPGEREAGADPVAPGRPGVVPDSLVYRREVFEYRRAQRRDPFRPLEARETVGPRFEDLVVQGILYQPTLGSVAVIVDRSLGDRYRVREGQRLGEARVLEIRRREVLFRIERFGAEQEEVLRVEKEEDQG